MMLIDVVAGIAIGACLSHLFYVFRGMFSLAVGRKEYPIFVLDDKEHYSHYGYRIYLTEEELSEVEKIGSVYKVIGHNDGRWKWGKFWL